MDKKREKNSSRILIRRIITLIKIIFKKQPKTKYNLLIKSFLGYFYYVFLGQNWTD